MNGRIKWVMIVPMNANMFENDTPINARKCLFISYFFPIILVSC